MLIINIIISFLLSYWLSAIILLAIGFLSLNGSKSGWKIFAWIFVAAAMLSLFFHLVSYFNSAAAILAAAIQTLKATKQEKKPFLMMAAFLLGWFLIFVIL